MRLPASKLCYNGQCEYCNKVRDKMFKCDKCLIARYCGRECQ